MSMCSLLLCCWKRVFAMTSAFSWQNSVSLWPALFYTPRTNLPIAPDICWLPSFTFHSPIMKWTSFWVLVLEGLIGLHRTIQLQLLQHYWSGHRLGLLWYWMVCLGNEQRSFCHFWNFEICLLAKHSDKTWSTGEGKGYPLQYAVLENSMDSPWGHKESDMTEPLSLSNEDLQDLLELTSKKDVLFIIGEWNAKVGS